MGKSFLALLEIHDVHFNWVKGHSGHPENERCDQLAVKGSKISHNKKVN